MRNSHIIVLLIMSWIIAAPAHAQTPVSGDWSGYYAGGSLGVAKGVADTKAATAIGGASSYFTSPDDTQIASAGNGSLSESGLSGGFFSGFGKQYGSTLVGVEISANSLRVDDARSRTATYITAPTAQFTLRQEVKADWQGTLRLRLGYAQKDWLAYVTGGAAVTRVKLNSSFSDNFMLDASGQRSNSETKVGWTLGVGGEYALRKNWSIRGQYLYADFGDVDTQSVVTNPSFPALSNNLRNSTELKTHTFSVGLAYHF